MIGFPWENGIEPYFVNEEGFEWYESKIIDDCCVGIHLKAKSLTGVKGFLVRKEEFAEYVLIDENQNIIYATQKLEQMFCTIDALRLSLDES
jgi:hypothetical protein